MSSSRFFSSHQFCLTCFINDIFNKCNMINNVISISDKCCCEGLFVDDIVLCALTRSHYWMKQMSD